MKRIISFILVLCMILGFTACGRTAPEQIKNTDSPETSDNARNNRTEETAYNRELLRLLEKAVETTQPGTAGTSLKAVYAMKDITDWLKENRPDMETVKETVKYFFESSEYADEAKEAFNSIKSAFDTIKESDAAQQLLDSVQIRLDELGLTDELTEYAEKLFDEIEKYIDKEK